MIRKRAASNVMSHSLGELELLVLEVLWKTPHLDARSVSEKLPPENIPSLSTVQSTLERLYKKNLVDRLKHRHAYTYFASVSRPSLLARLMSDVIHLLHDGKMETILSSFVNVAADLDEGSLNDLEALIRKKRAEISNHDTKSTSDIGAQGSDD
jgi:predicted transcriptional regulator